jgi:hypothetical protein
MGWSYAIWFGGWLSSGSPALARNEGEEESLYYLGEESKIRFWESVGQGWRQGEVFPLHEVSFYSLSGPDVLGWLSLHDRATRKFVEFFAP